MKNILLYYPFSLVENPKSGSQLRPLEMLKSFETFCQNNGFELIVIAGNSSERSIHWKTFLKSGKLENTLFCYSENQTIPLWLTDKGHIPKKPLIDLFIFRELNRRKIPIGLFYRDVYWKFDELYPLKGLKKAIMRAIYKLEERFYSKYLQTLFLPSESMGKYVDIEVEKVSLPPGGRIIETPYSERMKASVGIYVGGINNVDYGLSSLLKSYEIVNREEVISELKIVCREDEYANLSSEFKKEFERSYIEVLHISGQSLNEYYSQVDFAFIPRKKSTYNDFSVPVKLVEYLSAQLPVVATNCEAQESIINTGPYGVITEDHPESIALGIIYIQENNELFKKNIEEKFHQNHAWEARSLQVAKVLVGGLYESSYISSK